MQAFKSISLDPRLGEIAKMVGRCAHCADIGSDHGRLGAFLLQNHRCEQLTFTDLSAISLEKAKRLIRLIGLSDRASFCIGDGAQALTEHVDVAVIAGMGGETIAGIIRDACGHLDSARLILQPNVAVPQLRIALNASGYRITDERLVRDGRRIYVIIEAQPGRQTLSDTEAEVGPILLVQRPALLEAYAALRLRVAKRALEGARLGKEEAGSLVLCREIEIWKGVVSCL